VDITNVVVGDVTLEHLKEHIKITTKQGTFTLAENEDGSLEIRGQEPEDARTHLNSLTVRPRYANMIHVGFEPRIP